MGYIMGSDSVLSLSLVETTVLWDESATELDGLILIWPAYRRSTASANTKIFFYHLHEEWIGTSKALHLRVSGTNVVAVTKCTTSTTNGLIYLLHEGDKVANECVLGVMKVLLQDQSSQVEAEVVVKLMDRCWLVVLQHSGKTSRSCLDRVTSIVEDTDLENLGLATGSMWVCLVHWLGMGWES